MTAMHQTSQFTGKTTNLHYMQVFYNLFHTIAGSSPTTIRSMKGYFVLGRVNCLFIICPVNCVEAVEHKLRYIVH